MLTFIRFAQTLHEFIAFPISCPVHADIDKNLHRLRHPFSPSKADEPSIPSLNSARLSFVIGSQALTSNHPLPRHTAPSSSGRSYDESNFH
jgi:hypothetical protein